MQYCKLREGESRLQCKNTGVRKELWCLLDISYVAGYKGKRHTIYVQQRLCTPCSVPKLRIFHLAVFFTVDVGQEPCLSSGGKDDNWSSYWKGDRHPWDDRLIQ